MKPVVFVLLALLALCSVTRAADAVVGYYPYWVQNTYTPDDVDMHLLTHLVHAFAWPTADGDLVFPNNFLATDLVDAAHQQGVIVMLALGGWGQSDGFAPMAADSIARTKFAGTLLEFCLQHDYDGVDIDWEHPANSHDRANVSKLVRDIRAEFSKPMRPQPLYISMAVTAGNWAGQWLDYDELSKYVDWFGCMSYDFHGAWTNHSGHNSPLYASGGDGCGSADAGIRYLTHTRGLPADKVLLGVPFYARGFLSSGLYEPSSGDGGEFSYADVVAFMQSGWQRMWDDVALVPYLVNSERTRLISYDDTLSVRYKAEYAVEKNLHGVMIWALGQDLLGGDQPLLRAVSAPILRPTQVAIEKLAAPFDFSLSCSPNPFNDSAAISFTLSISQSVTLDILDANGRIVDFLYAGELPGGKNQFLWSARNHPSGVYLCRLKTKEFEQIINITLLR